MRCALVLGAGGLTGQAFHLGVLTALAEEVGFDGRRADLLVGTSAGSLVAATLAAGFTAADQAAMLLGEEVSDAGRRLLRQQRPVPPADAAARGRRGPLAPLALVAAARRPWAVRPGALLSGLAPAGRTTTDGIRRSISRMHGAAWPAALRVCAVRARDARRVVFGAAGAPAADVGSAVAASCAIPGYFQPVRIGGDAYVDGGGHSPTNADVVRPDRPALVVISSPMSVSPGRGGRPADGVLRLAARRYLAAEVRGLRRAGSQVVVFQPVAADLAAMGLNPMRLQRGEDVIAAAGATVRARLAAQPRLAELLRAAPG